MKLFQLSLASLTTLIAATTIAIAQVQPVDTPVQSGGNDVAVPSDAVPVIAEVVGVAGKKELLVELGSIPQFIPTQPIDPAPATVVAPGTRVILRPAAAFGAVGNVTWYRNDETIATNQAEWIITNADITDDGIYRASFDGNTEYTATDSLQLKIATADRPRISNQSTRLTLSPTAPSATFGFVIAPRAATSFRGRPFLIRVIGAGLSDFGVTQTVDDPVYTLRNAAGTDITTGLNFTQEVIDGKTSEQRYRDYVNSQSALVGAFPVVTDLQYAAAPRNLADATDLMPGAYTLTVRSESGATGDVLVEIYEVPQ